MKKFWLALTSAEERYFIRSNRKKIRLIKFNASETIYYTADNEQNFKVKESNMQIDISKLFPSITVLKETREEVLLVV